VVASPEPLECLDAPAVVALLAAGFAVVCSGGGGIPVFAGGTPTDGTSGGSTSGNRSYRGVEAVIDKDLTAALLARSLAADRLIIATDVEHVLLGWGTEQQRPLKQVAVADLEALAASGVFASGSMGPKVAAACRFVRQTSKPAAITSLSHIAAAVTGKYGTIVHPSPAESSTSEGDPGARSD
jgi:carbamate kinase